jgi:hypothetical protein
MKTYKIVITRPNEMVAFPTGANEAVAAHVAATYSGNPLRMVGTSSEISADKLTLILVRKFATEADAIAYSQDPVIVSFVASIPNASAGLAA